MTPEEQSADQHFEADLKAVCIHEAGHFEMSIAAGVSAVIRVDVNADGNLTGGWCFHNFEAPKFETSCIGWGGEIACALCGCVYRHSPQHLFPLTEEYLDRFFEECTFYLGHGGFRDS